MAQPPRAKPSLLTLPQELKDIIFEYVFTKEVYRRAYPQTSSELNGALLLTCRQTYRETRILYYKQTIFFTPFGRRPTWVHRMPREQRAAIKDVRCSDVWGRKLSPERALVWMREIQKEEERYRRYLADDDLEL